MAIKFRKPTQIRQGLKILAYGEDGSGKSIFGLSFPKIAIIDSESKLGVYENHPEFGKNILAIGDTADYYDVIELAETVIKNNKQFETFILDSETNLYESMQVAMMEVEEARAKRNNKNVDDQTVSQRGWGKVKLNNARLKNLKAQLSAKGVTIISIAHKEDIFEEVNGKQIRVGEKPALRKNSKHDYDVVLRFYKTRDIANGDIKLMVEVEKDTTSTLKVGDKIDRVSYDTFKQYIEGNKKNDLVNTNYDKTITGVVDKATQEAQSFDELSSEFAKLFKQITENDDSKKPVIANLLKERNIKTHKDAAYFEPLKEVVEIMRAMI